MRVIVRVFVFFIAALSAIQPTTGQSNTVLVVYPLGSSNTGRSQSVAIGTTIVFSCTIPGLGAYPNSGAFGYTELHAIVEGVDTVICSAAGTGACAQGSQAAPYASRSISVTVQSTVGTSFRMTAATKSDSILTIGYYCKISAGNVLYSQVMGVTTPLQVYAAANQPTLSFASGTNVFVSGQALPQITCTANVGEPYGWLKLTATGFIGTSITAPYPSYLNVVSNITVLESNGTYTMTYTFAYSSGTYTLTNNNVNDYFVCYAYNSYVYQSVTQSGMASVALTIQFQGLTQARTTPKAGVGAVGLNGGGVASVVIAIIVVVINAMYANGDASVYGVLFSSESTTPTANMAAPPAYPGRARAEANANANATTARGNRHDTLPAPNGYGTINSHFGTIDSYVQI